MAKDEIQSTHWETCYEYHHACAIARVQRLEGQLQAVKDECVRHHVWEQVPEQEYKQLTGLFKLAKYIVETYNDEPSGWLPVSHEDMELMKRFVGLVEGAISGQPQEDKGDLSPQG